MPGCAWEIKACNYRSNHNDLRANLITRHLAQGCGDAPENQNGLCIRTVARCFNRTRNKRYKCFTFTRVGDDKLGRKDQVVSNALTMEKQKSYFIPANSQDSGRLLLPRWLDRYAGPLLLVLHPLVLLTEIPHRRVTGQPHRRQRRDELLACRAAGAALAL